MFKNNWVLCWVIAGYDMICKTCKCYKINRICCKGTATDARITRICSNSLYSSFQFDLCEEILRQAIYFKVTSFDLRIIYVDVDIIRRRSLRREIGTYKGTWKGRRKAGGKSAIGQSTWLLCFLYTAVFITLSILQHNDEINNLTLFKILRLFLKH